ncbi:hypothetical protein [Rhizobium grahamii]|uniref:Uncharacterized protein n=1 Tax=Rhizobium grahamii TaxID=1120045 RepID=A0A370KSP3_9HYPH|nr:hypothetical protein [Rhizobium grahamii]RDJ12415.1 hypothetical protein B5K06_11815 [Rhizobium grahamii]
MRVRNIAALIAAAGMISCAQASAIRTSQNEMLIQSSAAPVCGGIGAMKVAQKQAAIETIKAGYDRYIITNGQSANNVTTYQAPGTFNTVGTVGAMGSYTAQTTYTPGPMMTAGTHDQALGIHMFKEGDPGYSNAISARDVLGPKWAVIVKDGVMTCTN